MPISSPPISSPPVSSDTCALWAATGASSATALSPSHPAQLFLSSIDESSLTALDQLKEKGEELAHNAIEKLQPGPLFITAASRKTNPSKGQPVQYSCRISLPAGNGTLYFQMQKISELSDKYKLLAMGRTMNNGERRQLAISHSSASSANVNSGVKTLAEPGLKRPALSSSGNFQKRPCPTPDANGIPPEQDKPKRIILECEEHEDLIKQIRDNLMVGQGKVSQKKNGYTPNTIYNYMTEVRKFLKYLEGCNTRWSSIRGDGSNQAPIEITQKIQEAFVYAGVKRHVVSALNKGCGLALPSQNGRIRRAEALQEKSHIDLINKMRASLEKQVDENLKIEGKISRATCNAYLNCTLSFLWYLEDKNEKLPEDWSTESGLFTLGDVVKNAIKNGDANFNLRLAMNKAFETKFLSSDSDKKEPKLGVHNDILIKIKKIESMNLDQYIRMIKRLFVHLEGKGTSWPAFRAPSLKGRASLKDNIKAEMKDAENLHKYTLNAVTKMLPVMDEYVSKNLPTLTSGDLTEKSLDILLFYVPKVPASAKNKIVMVLTELLSNNDAPLTWVGKKGDMDQYEAINPSGEAIFTRTIKNEASRHDIMEIGVRDANGRELPFLL